MPVLDCVKSPPIDAMRAAGVTGLCRYLSWADQRDTLGKVIHNAEYDQLLAAGFTVLLNWEYSANDWLGGGSAAQAHATEAVRQAKALGYPAGCAIPGSADLNMTLAQWNSAGAAYANVFGRVIRDAGYVPGVYGPWDVLTWCRDTGWFGMYWQAGMSTSWSAGRNAQLWPGAHLRQRRNGFVGGLDVDFNDIIQANYGQAGGDEMDDATLNLIWANAWITQCIAEDRDTITVPARPETGYPGYSVPNTAKQERQALAAAVANLTTDGVDVQALATQVAALLPAAPTAADIAKAVNDDAAARLQS